MLLSFLRNLFTNVNYNMWEDSRYIKEHHILSRIDKYTITILGNNEYCIHYLIDVDNGFCESHLYFYKAGLLHNINGPAIFRGNSEHPEYYISGRRVYKPENFKEQVRNYIVENTELFKNIYKE